MRTSERQSEVRQASLPSRDALPWRRVLSYKYKRYDDVRLVFAPEADIASFGGDPDNFQFPRWSLDFSICEPTRTASLPSRPIICKSISRGPAANQLVFVAGHPGSTARMQTRAQLEFDRDLPLPITLLRAAELRGRFIQFGTANPADDRICRRPSTACKMRSRCAARSSMR